VLFLAQLAAGFRVLVWFFFLRVDAGPRPRWFFPSLACGRQFLLLSLFFCFSVPAWFANQPRLSVENPHPRVPPPIPPFSPPFSAWPDIVLFSFFFQMVKNKGVFWTPLFTLLFVFSRVTGDTFSSPRLRKAGCCRLVLLRDRTFAGFGDFGVLPVILYDITVFPPTSLHFRVFLIFSL